jgi:hypothetical protein
MSRHVVVRPVLLAAAVAAGLAGCPLESLFPAEVGAGAARLTVRNAALLAKFVDLDTRCGFGSPDVLAGFTVDGEVGEVGQVTWRVDGCVLDFGDDTVINEDCHGVTRRAGGRVTIDAVRTVRGVLTGDPITPVVPLAADAAHLVYTADVDDFVVRLSDSDAAVTMHAGRLSLDADAHLAVSAAEGVCSIDTADVTVHALTVQDARYSVENEGSVFAVPVPALNVTAQLGRWQDRENTIAGTIRVWDTDVDLDDDPVLDPTYDREHFRASYECTANLQLPVSYSCPDLGETVVRGATRLLLNDTGMLVQAIVADTRCGFAAPDVVAGARLTGEIGRPGGEAVFTIDRPCAIDLPAERILGEDCNGTATIARGRATLRGSMRQRGRLTGDPLQPVIPASRDAVEIVFDIAFDGWQVTTTDGRALADGPSFLARTGGITGTMRPRLAKDTLTGACALPTPVVAFDSLVVKPGTSGLLVKDGLAMGVTFRSGTFDAQAGDRDGVANTLTGDVVVDTLGEEARAIDVSGDLDPDYDAAVARRAFTCTPNLVVPADDAACDFAPVLAENVGRLAIQTAGTLASMINTDDQCGFADQLGVLLWPSDVQGDSGDLGSMSWDIRDCTIATSDARVLAEDCVGTTTWVEGDADFVDVGRTVRGEREKQFFVVDSIVPRDPAAVDVFLREVVLRDFATYTIAAGADEAEGILVIHDGVLSAVVQPALGARADDPSVVDVPTPVAVLSDVRLSGDATLYAQGKVFSFRIDDTQLSATNGRFAGGENALAGTVVLDGETHTLGGLRLNPAYAPSSFEEAYVCTDNLAGPVR